MIHFKMILKNIRLNEQSIKNYNRFQGKTILVKNKMQNRRKKFIANTFNLKPMFKSNKSTQQINRVVNLSVGLSVMLLLPYVFFSIKLLKVVRFFVCLTNEPIVLFIFLMLYRAPRMVLGYFIPILKSFSFVISFEENQSPFLFLVFFIKKLKVVKRRKLTYKKKQQFPTIFILYFLQSLLFLF